MDVEALVAVARRRLQLRRLLIAIERDPQLLEGGFMALKIKKPIELAGLKSHLIRAEGQEKAISKLGEGYGKVLDDIDELVGAHAEHLGELEHYEGDLGRKIEGMVGSNGGPNESEDGRGSGSDGGQGQIISSETGK